VARLHRIFSKWGATMAHLRRIFLVFSLSLPIEAAEAVFKGVQIMHITLGLADFSHYRWLYHANGEGVAPLFS
jgi:hypothetical protein